MPNQPKTPHRTLRIDPDLWTAALTRARSEGTTVTAIVVAALHAYVKGAK